jgi:hypothetical protein
MGIPILHVGAVVNCVHGGVAQPLLRNPRVKVSGMNVLTITCNEAISGCPLPVPAGGPCVTATWTSGATRVRAGGLPVLLSTSIAQCVPTGTGLVVVGTQTRVTAV